MATYKFTTAERASIRSWLEKKPGSEDNTKVWFFKKEDGTQVAITRVTQYIPGGKWKVRIAFTEDGGFPILMSGPLTAGSNQKVTPPTKKTVVPKSTLSLKEVKSAHPEDYVTFEVQTGLPPAKKNVLAFQKAVELEMKAIKKQINAPSIWSSISPSKDICPDCGTDCEMK